MTRKLAWTLVLAACGCSETPTQVEVSLQFDPPELAAQAVSVELRVDPGGCVSVDLGGEPRLRFERDGAGSARLELAGPGFLTARARDASCRWFARACALVPAAGEPGRIVLDLQAADALPMCEPDRCVEGICEGGDLPEPFVPAELRDAGARPPEEALDDGRDPSP